MKQLYDEIKSIIPPLPGWCEISKAIGLANIVLATKPKIIVELGIWGGRSLIPLALAARWNGIGKVIGVDPWTIEASVEGQVTDPDRQHWQNSNHEIVYRQFMDNLDKLRLASICEIHRCKSEQIEIPDGTDLFHLDQNHGEQAFKEMVRCEPRISTYGYVILDDLSWAGGHVQHTADWLKDNGYLCLHTLGTGAVYLKMPK